MPSTARGPPASRTCSATTGRCSMAWPSESITGWSRSALMAATSGEGVKRLVTATPPRSAHRHGVGVPAGAQHRAGRGAGRLRRRPTVGDAVDEHVVRRRSSRRGGARHPRAGRSMVGPADSTVAGSSTTRSARTPRRSGRGRAGRRGGPAVGHSGARRVPRHQPASPEAVGEERGGVGRAAHAVEVGAGIGPAEHHVRVVPQAAAQAPRLVVVVRRHRPQHGAQVVVEHDVDAACRTVARRARRRSRRPAGPSGRRWRGSTCRRSCSRRSRRAAGTRRLRRC